MKYLYFLIAMVAICPFFQGCKTTEKNTDTLSANYSLCPEFKMASVLANAILTVYQEQNSSFITNQQYEICLCDETMLVSTIIEEQKILFKLTMGKDLKILSGDSAFKNSPLIVFDREKTELILNMIKSNQTMASKSQQPINMYGQWYRIAYRNEKGVIFYQNTNDSKVDLIVSQNFIARGYDYRKVDGFNHTVPSTIEILNIGKGKSPGNKIMKIEYNSFANKNL